MKGSGTGYLVKTGIKSIWHNKLMSLASIAVLSACLMILGVAALFSVNMGEALAYVESQNEIVVFIAEEATDEERADLEALVASTGNVESYQYISKEDALKETKEEFGPDSALLDGLEEDNPLPASYRVKLQNLDYMYDTVSTFQNAPGVETVSYPQDVAETIVSLKNMVSIFGIAIIAVFVAVSLVIISNTIRLTVFARRREINIMKYVGATNGFIRLPFVVEGMFIGLLAAFIAYFAVWGGYQGIMNMIMGTTSQFLQSMADSLIPFGEIWYWVLAGFALTGMGTGALGSVLSIRKHLKV